MVSLREVVCSKSVTSMLVDRSTATRTRLGVSSMEMAARCGCRAIMSQITDKIMIRRIIRL